MKTSTPKERALASVESSLRSVERGGWNRVEISVNNTHHITHVAIANSIRPEPTRTDPNPLHAAPQLTPLHPNQINPGRHRAQHATSGTGSSQLRPSGRARAYSSLARRTTRVACLKAPGFHAGSTWAQECYGEGKEGLWMRMGFGVGIVRGVRRGKYLTMRQWG